MLKRLNLTANLILFVSKSKLALACSNHDIETVYGGHNYLHKVTSALYAMDEQSFDIAVAGMIQASDNKSRQFLYYIDDGSCSVKWHYIFEKDDSVGNIVDEFKALAIRSSTDIVYGII